MNSRERILSKIKVSKPDLIELPTINSDIFFDGRDLLEEFTKKTELAGGNVFNALSNSDVITQTLLMFPDSKFNFSILKGTSDFNTISLDNINDPREMEDLDILVLESDLAVAENGAVWITDNQISMRVLPFIAKHLVIVIIKDNIVPFLHQAYHKLSSEETNFGVFISGPSKTADIEQSLVIGAQGALSLSVFLL